MTAAIDPQRDLVLTRLIDAPPRKLFRAWTEPELMVQWFTPAPFTTASAEVELRPGGSNLVVMRGPDGQEYPNPGVYLEVVPNKRLVITNAYTRAWEPSQERPLMTIVLDFAEENGKTRYTALVRHWTPEGREEHEKMGFHDGWRIATDQLEALVKKI